MDKRFRNLILVMSGLVLIECVFVLTQQEKIQNTNIHINTQQLQLLEKEELIKDLQHTIFMLNDEINEAYNIIDSLNKE